jgi:hypothetical protein
MSHRRTAAAQAARSIRITGKDRDETRCVYDTRRGDTKPGEKAGKTYDRQAKFIIATVKTKQQINNEKRKREIAEWKRNQLQGSATR